MFLHLLILAEFDSISSAELNSTLRNQRVLVLRYTKIALDSISDDSAIRSCRFARRVSRQGRRRGIRCVSYRHPQAVPGNSQLQSMRVVCCSLSSPSRVSNENVRILETTCTFSYLGASHMVSCVRKRSQRKSSQSDLFKIQKSAITNRSSDKQYKKIDIT